MVSVCLRGDDLQSTNGRNAHRQLLLGDGRRLGWDEYGSPDGLPLLYCHGFPACGREARLLHDAAFPCGIRIIAPDRPGFGASDFRHDRTLLDWAGDLAALADHLGLERFALLGVSGGGPYALAAARRLGPRLSALALVGGLGPVDRDDLRKAMRWPARGSFRLARRHPRLTDLVYGRLLAPPFRRYPATVLALLSAAAPKADRRTLADGTVRSILADSIRGAFCSGGRGAVHELGIYAGPWGFDPREIELPVTLWHGLDDVTVPPDHGRWLAGRFSNCRPVFVPDEGHFSLPVRYASRILQDLYNFSGAG